VRFVSSMVLCISTMPPLLMTRGAVLHRQSHTALVLLEACHRLLVLDDLFQRASPSLRAGWPSWLGATQAIGWRVLEGRTSAIPQRLARAFAASVPMRRR